MDQRATPKIKLFDHSLHNAYDTFHSSTISNGQSARKRGRHLTGASGGVYQSKIFPASYNAPNASCVEDGYDPISQLSLHLFENKQIKEIEELLLQGYVSNSHLLSTLTEIENQFLAVTNEIITREKKETMEEPAPAQQLDLRQKMMDTKQEVREATHNITAIFEDEENVH